MKTDLRSSRFRPTGQTATAPHPRTFSAPFLPCADGCQCSKRREAPGNLTAKKDADFPLCARKAVQPRRSDGADDATVAGRPRAAGLTAFVAYPTFSSRDSPQITQPSASGTARLHTNKNPTTARHPVPDIKERVHGRRSSLTDNGTASALAHPAAWRPCGLAEN
ncbi:hypothetical protein RB531_2137 [Salmonella enterica subsp. enterica serovar Typhimurium]